MVDRVTAHAWNVGFGQWLGRVADEPSCAALVKALDKHSNEIHHSERSRRGMEMRNSLVHRLQEEVDLFIMSPECTPALRHLDSMKGRLEFHFDRISKTVVLFAEKRLRELPYNADKWEAPAIVSWAQCVAYELMCDLLKSLIEEVASIRQEALAVARHQPSTTPPEESVAATDCRREGLSSATSGPRTGAVVRPKRKSGRKDEPDLEEHNSKTKRNRGVLTQGAREIFEQWLRNHWHDPYPTLAEKEELASKCKITVNQVNHWFINARVRRWRPTMERAASEATETGNNTPLAALIKNCGDKNVFAKFLNPAESDPQSLPGAPAMALAKVRSCSDGATTKRPHG